LFFTDLRKLAFLFVEVCEFSRRVDKAQRQGREGVFDRGVARGGP